MQHATPATGPPAETGSRSRTHHFAQKAVEREAEAQGEADPQLAESAGGEHANAGRGDRDRGPLQPAQMLVQDEAAEKHVGEGIEVIAEARREDVPADHRIGVEQPVAADEKRGEQQDADRLATRERSADLSPAFREQDEEGEERQRPEHAVSDDVDRRHARQSLEIDGEHAPQRISAEAIKKAEARPGLARRTLPRRWLCPVHLSCA
jgi:hypothetical protein